MKKLLVLLFCVIVYISCHGRTNENNTLHAQEGQSKMETEDSTVSKSFGSFLLSNDWIENTQQSRNEKYFYTDKSESNNTRSAPTNISIEAGRNRYDLSEIQNFSHAILQQLARQTGGRLKIEAVGTSTENGYPLLIFTMKDEERNITTIQYYIVGDRKHILIHLTDFHKENVLNAEKVAQKMADSFLWAE